MSEQASISTQAVALWEELTGKSVNSSSYTFRVGGHSFDLYQANKRVQQAQTVGAGAAVYRTGCIFGIRPDDRNRADI